MTGYTGPDIQGQHSYERPEPAQIAKLLKDDGVLMPSEYQRTIGVNCPTKLPEYPHKWCSHTVAEILDRQEYVGDTVNFRTDLQSFKQKQLKAAIPEMEATTDKAADLQWLLQHHWPVDSA